MLQIYAEQQEAYQAAVAADESVDFEGENLLARLCAYSNIDLIRLIQENSFLQTFETYRLLAKVKNGSGPKKTSLAHAIEAKFMQLHEFALLNNPLTVSPSEKKEAEKANEQVQFASDSGSNDKQEKDSSAAILQRVDSLMASNKYYEAINLLKEIDKEEDLYDKAQEKVSTIANKAVSDLRKKAADSYRKANQLKTDIKAREVYLVEAKTILQAAIDLYPQAKQITRVKRNLKIIDDNLKFLRKGRLEKR